MRSISFVASGVEICPYDSMVSCQWPNVLPGVSALSWSFVVSVLFQSTWFQSAVTKLSKCSTNISEAQWRTQKIFMGEGFHSVAYCGNLYLVCAVCDVTIWRHSHVSTL